MRHFLRALRVAAAAAAPALAPAPIAAQSGGAGPVTVFVVRHAEKGPESPDPSLTPAGVARAEALAHALGDARITAIFVSEFKRTQETAAPLARRIGLEPLRLDAGKLDELVARLQALAPGSRALVVSHSNLVPAIVAGLAAVPVGELTDLDYDRMYAVTRAGSGPPSVLYLHFGVPAPPRP
jgi:broad specificity phosphatase PhoE